MNFKDVLIVTDLDGTLLDDEKNIAAEDIAAINDFRSKGGLFAAATGRGVAMARRIIDELDITTPCVIFNGAAVYDFKADKFLWHSDMPEIADTYIRMLEKKFPDIGIEILHEKDVYVTDNNQTVVEHMAFEKLTPVYSRLEDVPKDGRYYFMMRARRRPSGGPAKRETVSAKIDGDVENRASQHPDKLCLGVFLLEMKPAQNAFFGFGLIILNKDIIQSRFFEILFVIGFHEIATMIPKNFGFNHIDPFDFCLNEVEHLDDPQCLILFSATLMRCLP